MKKRINLLIKKKDYQKKEIFFKFLRTTTVIIGLITVFLLFIIFYLYQQIYTQYSRLLSKKEDYLNKLILKKDIEKKIIFFNEKSILFNKIKKEDLNFPPYYTVLKAYLPVSTQSADIKSIKYNNKRDIQFDLAFSSYQDLYNSLSNFENDKFLGIFESLTINSINLSESKIKNYKLSLDGRLKIIPVNKQE